MQTFLPYPSYVRSAQCLDYRRLGKQRLEALGILQTLLGLSEGWAHHPAVRMWRGCEASLVEYGLTMCREWIRRGYLDTRTAVFATLSEGLGTAIKPDWLGDPAFHASHRSNLLRKNPEHYSQFGWTETPDLPYVWPKGRR